MAFAWMEKLETKQLQMKRDISQGGNSTSVVDIDPSSKRMALNIDYF